VTAPGKTTKEDYINAILLSRHPIEFEASQEGAEAAAGAAGAAAGGAGAAAGGAGAAAGGAGAGVVHNIEMKLLMSKTVEALKEIARKGNVSLPKAKSKMNKNDYAAAIYAMRAALDVAGVYFLCLLCCCCCCCMWCM